MGQIKLSGTLRRNVFPTFELVRAPLNVIASRCDRSLSLFLSQSAHVTDILFIISRTLLSNSYVSAGLD